MLLSYKNLRLEAEHESTRTSCVTTLQRGVLPGVLVRGLAGLILLPLGALPAGPGALAADVATTSR